MNKIEAEILCSLAQANLCMARAALINTSIVSGAYKRKTPSLGDHALKILRTEAELLADEERRAVAHLHQANECVEHALSLKDTLGHQDQGDRL